MQREDTPDETIRVAVAGIGEHAEHRLLPAIASVPSLRLSAVATREAGKAARLRERYPGVRIFHDSADEGWLAAADLLVAGGPPDFNAAVVARGLRSGKHVFCEKPLATSAVQIDALLTQARAAPQSTTALGLNLKYSATVNELVARAADDPVVTAYVEYATSKPTEPAWGAPSTAITCAWWHAIHVLDLLQTIIGRARLSAVKLDRLDHPHVAIHGELDGDQARGSFLIRNSAPAFSLTIRVLSRSGTVTTLTDLRTLSVSGPARSAGAAVEHYRTQPAEFSISPLADNVDCSGFRSMFAQVARAIAGRSQPPSSFQAVAGAHALLFELVERLSLQEQPST